MNTLLLAITAAALVALVVLMLRPNGPVIEDRPEEDRRISPLLRGINYLLSDEPDMALQEMVQVARLRSESADVYMALGEMFRSKGEIGRAVRIHQNLLARPDLPQSMHLQAHIALAIDFQTGGLLDRALLQYQKALDIQSDHVGALEASMRIREQSSEWVMAEELLSRLERVKGESYGSHRAYLFAEVARQCLRQGELEQAHGFAVKALELDVTCAPARIVNIELALQKKDSTAAEAEIGELWKNASEHFPLIIPVLLQHGEFYELHGREMLRELSMQRHDPEVLLAWLEAVAGEHSAEEARRLCQALAYEPNSLRASLRLHAIVGADGDAHAQFSRLWREKAKNYVCDQCGVEVVEMRWQCPQCHSWGSLHPKSKEKI